MADFDISAMFSKAFNDAEPKKTFKKPEGCFEWKECMATWTRGSLVGVMIPDKNGAPFKTLSRVLFGKIKYNDDNGNEVRRVVRWCDSSNYKNLTDEQKALNKALNAEINRYIELNPGISPKMKFSSKVSYCYFAIKKYIPEEGESKKYDNPNVTLLINAASTFVDAFKTKIKSTTDTYESSSWMNKFFNRNEGNHDNLINVTTTQPGGRGQYSVSFAFENLPSLAVNIDASHLEAANDLNHEFINTDEYDTNNNKEILDILKKVNDLKGDVSKLPEVKGPDIQTPNPSETVEVPRNF